MIPKILHYCWFGRGAMDELSRRCLKSWEKYCPDYQIKIWNEDSFDVSSNAFTKEAYEEKKWAFVTDYVRLYALYTEGGIYLDADVELLKNLDDLLTLGGVVTSYQECTIPAAIMLAEKGNPWIKDLLSYYDNRHFRLPTGHLDMLQNDRIITAISMQKWNFKMGNTHIDYGNVHIFPSVYFAPYRKSRKNEGDPTANFKIDSRTYAIHHGIGSWSQPKSKKLWRLRTRLLSILRRTIPEKVYLKIKWIFMKEDLFCFNVSSNES